MSLAERLTRLSLAHPVAVFAAALLLTGFFALGIPRVQRETALRTFLGADHPTVRRLDWHLDTFGGGYPVIVAFSCEDTRLCQSVFDAEALRMADEVVRALAGVPGVRSVHAPSNSPLLVPAGDDLAVRRFVEDGGSIAPDREALAARASLDPLWQRNVVAQGGRVGAIVIELTSSEGDVQGAVASALDAALSPHERAGWTFHRVGELIDFVHSGIEVERDSQALVPVMVAVLSLVLVVLLRSVVLVLATVGAMGLASLWTQGTMGWAGVELNAITTVTPSMVLAIGILDSVHLIAHYSERCAASAARTVAARQSALVETAREIGSACLLTSLTIMGAFASFAASGIAAFAQFGLVTAWGILVALVLTFTVLPVALARLPVLARPGTARTEAAWKALLAAVVETGRRRRGRILVGTAVLTTLCLVGVARVRVEISAARLLGEQNRVSRWSQWVAKNLRETEVLEVALALPEGASYQDPASLERIDRISRWLDEDLPGIAHPQSILGPLRWLNRVLHGDRPEYERTEASRSANAQLAALLSINDPDAIDRWVARTSFAEDGAGSRERVVLRISAEAEAMSTARQAEVLGRLREHLDRTLPPGWSYALTGSVPMYLDMMTSLERSQLECFGIAGVVVFAMMAVFFRSVSLSLLVMLPTVVAVAVTVGLLGLWDYGLDPASTMVATIILGVGVDDGIHLLTHYRVRRATGSGQGEAIAAAVMHVGKPVVVSSFVLAAAFWSLSLSRSASVASFGFLAAVAVLASLFADLFLLPALLASRPGREPAGGLGRIS